MSDKISDKELSLFVSNPTDNFLSRGGMMQVAQELIARRAADLPPVLKLPEAIIYDLRVPPYVGYAYPKDKTDAALKAAGITVQDNSNDKIR